MTSLDPAAFAGPLTVTLLYVGVYYAFQINVLRVKSRLSRGARDRGEKFDRYFGQDREMLAADRTQLNMLEHMGPFLALLWLYAVFVSPQGATIAGGAYVASRSLYPFMMGRRLGRGIRSSVMLSTGVGYGVLVFFAGSLVWALVG